jgi:CDP-6-deoxy-D-xylo-4-hexulose-3-dehydrase
METEIRTETTERTEQAIRREIFERVEELYRLRESTRQFVPGQSRVPYAGRVFDEREMIHLVDSALDFWLTAGRFAEEFETRLAAFLGAPHCLLANSGSSANLLATFALTSPQWGHRRLLPGDEVITVAAAFPTTLNPIVQAGAVPVLLDVDLATANIQADKVEPAVTGRTKAIILGHTLGNPFDLDTIAAVARKRGLWLIEDSCDALGATYKGRMAGTFGDAATFSFYPPHHITMGEGGAVVCGDPAMRRVVESFRDWGRDCWCPPGRDDSCGKRFDWQFGSLPRGYDHKYIFSHIGFNLKATDMQAAVGVAQLEKLPGFIAARRRNWQTLRDALERYEDFFILPRPTPGAEPSWFGFLLTIREGAPFTREAIVRHLESKGIATRMLFGGNLIRQPAYAEAAFRIFDTLDNTDRLMNDAFWLGVYPGLTEAMIEYMLGAFGEFMRSI